MTRLSHYSCCGDSLPHRLLLSPRRGTDSKWIIPHAETVLGRAGFPPDRLAAKATITLEQAQGNWTITTITLALDAKIPGIDRAKFDEIANDAKKNCPVSRVLNANSSLQATLQA